MSAVKDYGFLTMLPLRGKTTFLYSHPYRDENRGKETFLDTE